MTTENVGHSRHCWKFPHALVFLYPRVGLSGWMEDSHLFIHWAFAWLLARTVLSWVLLVNHQAHDSLAAEAELANRWFILEKGAPVHRKENWNRSLGYWPFLFILYSLGSWSLSLFVCSHCSWAWFHHVLFNIADKFWVTELGYRQGSLNPNHFRNLRSLISVLSMLQFLCWHAGFQQEGVKWSVLISS